MCPGTFSITKHGAKPGQKLKKWPKMVRQGWNGMEVPPDALELYNIFYTSIFKPYKKIHNKDNNYKFYQILQKRPD